MESGLEKVVWFQYFTLLLIKKKTKSCKQQKIGGFEYFGDFDVMNKLKESENLFTISESLKYSNPPIFCCLQNFVFFLIKSRAKYLDNSNSNILEVPMLWTSNFCSLQKDIIKKDWTNFSNKSWQTLLFEMLRQIQGWNQWEIFQ